MAKALDVFCLVAAASTITALLVTASGEPVDLPLALLILVGGWFAWVLLPQSFTGFTPGKAVFGIRAFAGDASQEQAPPSRLLVKSLAELVWLIPLVFVASCVTIFGKQRRTIPDMIAKTSVVRHAPAAATRWASGALAVLVLATTTGYGYLSVWRPAAGIGNNWETLDSFYDADEVRAEILSDPDVSDYDMVVFRDSDVPVWDIIYSRGDAAEHATLDDELWDDFLMVDCYWFSDDPAGSPSVAFDWPALPASGAGVELSWSASSGSAGRAVGLMSYGPRSETQAPGAWIADPGLAEADIRDNLRAEGYAPEELEVPIVLRGFYEALLTADTITLDVGGSRHTWVLPEDARPLRDLMRRCAPSTAAATQPTPSSAAPPSNTATAGADVGDCDFADRAATVRAAVFQVVTPDGTGTAFHIGNGEWLTAAHVVANQTRVSLRNGSATIAATVKGGNLDTDIALLEADTAGVEALRFARIEYTRPGSSVYTAGFPMGSTSTLTVAGGVLSAWTRDDAGYEEVVTDAAVNPGNSGGPLLDACGAVLGMNVAKLVAVEVEGVGYAVAETTLQDGLPTLRAARPGSVAAPEPEPAAKPAAGWFHDPGANIDGDYDLYWTEAVWHSGPAWSDPPQLMLRCGEGATASINDAIAVWTPWLIFNDLSYDSSTVRYRFENMPAPDAEWWWSSEDPESVLFAYADTRFARQLARAGSGSLHMELIPGSSARSGESAEFVVDGATEVLRDLDCW